jgi:hypothetical protein
MGDSGRFSEAEAGWAQEPLWAKDFYQGCGTEEGSKGQGHLGPFAGIAADGEDCQPDECGCGGGEDGQQEAFEAAAKAQPCSEHGHQLGVSQADAFAAADDPVGEADEEDRSGWSEDGERGMPGGVGKVDGIVEKPARPGSEEREQEARADAGQREPVGKPEVLRVEHGQGYEKPAKHGIAEELDQGVGEEMRDFGIAGVGCEQGLGESDPATGP